MLPYATIQEAEAALGRPLTGAETIWFNYSATKSDYFLYCHNILFLFLIFSFVPLYYYFLEFFLKNYIRSYKLQPKVNLTLSESFRCYKSVMRMFILVVGPLQLVSFMHCKWGYEKIHKVHHEYAAPIGFAAPYAHWAEILILGIPSFLGPAMVPGHIITFWLWIGLRQIEAIETHSGWNATATNGAMFAKVVPSIHRAMIYAFECAFEISFSSFIAPTTGILVEKIYGHDAKSVHLNGSPREAYALSRGLFAMMYSSHVHPCGQSVRQID
nr:methylsterol monooxygenase 1-1-like [Ipomoea batatas]